MRARAGLLGLACLACCLPLVLTIVGATAGVGGAVGAWLGRFDVLIVSLTGLAVVLTVAIGEGRTRQKEGLDREEEDALT